MKSILVHFLMGKSLLNITLTIRFAKLIKAQQQQKTKACFTAKIFTHYLQSIFEVLINYVDIFYDQPHNSSFCGKLESVQYKATLVLTGAIQGTSFEKIFQELGLESIKSRRQFKRLCCMFKIMKNEAPNYLISLIPKRKRTFDKRNKYLPTYNCRTDCFEYSFFSCTLNDCFNLDVSIRKLRINLNFQM